MKPDLSAWFHRLWPAKRISSLSNVARRSLYIALALHLAALFVAGVVVVGYSLYNRPTTFVGQPPPWKSYDPKQIELRVKVSKQARAGSRPAMQFHLTAATPTTGIALPAIAVNPAATKSRFTSTFKPMGTGGGYGIALDDGYALGGFGPGVSDIDFMSIRARGERIAILVDVSVSMVEDQKGGFSGYRRVKDRINQVIDKLAEGTLFNVIVFADAASAWQKTLVVATDDNKTKARLFLNPFDTSGNVGLTGGNLAGSNLGLPAAGGTTRLDLALEAAFEEGADTILVISDGLPRVRKGVTAEQGQAYAALVARWNQENATALAAWNATQAAAAATAPPQSVRVWIPPTPAVPARPPARTSLKEGQSPDAGSPAIPAQPGHWEVRTVADSGHGGDRPQPPAVQDPGWWSLSDFVEHLRILHERFYLAKGKKLPSLHCIGYGIDKEGGDFLKVLSMTYHGQYKQVTKLN